MQDIRKPYTRSRSNRNLYDQVEQFESGTYMSHQDHGDEPVRIPVKGQRGRRNVDAMEMYPRGRHSNQDDFLPSDAPHHRDIDRDPRTRYSSERSSLGTWIFVFVVSTLVILAGLFTYVFNNATITIVPKYQDVDVHKTILFSTDSSNGAVPFVLSTSSIQASKKLSLTETKKIESKASGKIIIYNNFDSQPQRLIKNTRFETESGQIYRISESAVIPGKKGDKPGSVSATIYADNYGTSYNSEPTDFTIPGFKGTPRYDGFFARSDGPITGGASGDVSLASLADINAAKDELAIELTQKIKDKLLSVKVDGYTGLYSSPHIIIQDNERELLAGNSSEYQATAIGYLIFADTKILSKTLASELRDYGGEPVTLAYTDEVTFTLKDSTNLETATSAEVLIDGNPRIVWLTDHDAIKKLFMGKDRSEFKSIMNDVTSVGGGEISFSPLWLSTFPTDSSKVHVVEKLPKR